jgi:hypothetical protein
MCAKPLFGVPFALERFSLELDDAGSGAGECFDEALPLKSDHSYVSSPLDYPASPPALSERNHDSDARSPAGSASAIAAGRRSAAEVS